MKKGLNILHYCIYKAHYKMHLLFNKINPFRLIHKLPFQKKRYEQLGIDIDDEINKAFSNRIFGLSTTVAGGGIFGICFILLMAVAIIAIKAVNRDFILAINPYYFLLLVLPSLAVCYFFVFKRDMYLEYFDRYDHWTKTEKRKYGWSSFIFIAAVLFIFVLGFLI
jgi:hypothetical protein